MTTQYLWLVVFAVVMYFIATDESIAAGFYTIKLAKAYIQRQWWWLLNNPRNPVVKYLMYRRYLKMAENMMAKISRDNEKE